MSGRRSRSKRSRRSSRRRKPRSFRSKLPCRAQARVRAKASLARLLLRVERGKSSKGGRGDSAIAISLPRPKWPEFGSPVQQAIVTAGDDFGHEAEPWAVLGGKDGNCQETGECHCGAWLGSTTSLRRRSSHCSTPVGTTNIRCLWQLSNPQPSLQCGAM